MVGAGGTKPPGSGVPVAVTLTNDGDAAVELDPRVVGIEQAPETLPAEWVTVDAPAEIGPGETARIDFTVAPPADAESSRYDVEYTLGIDDPARSDEDDYWQRVDLSVGVWQVPEEPITRTFEVRPATDTVTITLSASAGDERPEFQVEIVDPDGDRRELRPVSVSKRGGVDLVESGAESAERRGHGPHYEITYAVDVFESGEYTLAVLPENTPQFGWEIVTEEDR